MNRTIVAVCALCVMLVAPVALKAEDSPAGELPFKAWTGCEPRLYGYFTGDRLTCTFILVAPKSVTFDTSRFPHKGESLNGFEIYDAEERVATQGNMVRRTFRFTIQAFYVFPRPLSVPFSPFIVIWTNTYTPDHKPIKWRVTRFVGPRVVVSQVTQSDFLNELQPPMGPVVDDISRPAWQKIILGSVFLVLGMALLAVAGFLGRNYLRNSPFLRALRLLEAEAELSSLRKSVTSSNDDSLDARALKDIFRDTLRKKFVLPGAPTPEDVYDALCASRRYRSCAEEGRRLWALGDALLYDNAKDVVAAGAYEAVRGFFRRMAQYELV